MSGDSLLTIGTEIWIQIDTVISCLCLVLFLPRTQRGFDVFCCCCNRMLSRIMKKALQKSTVRSLHTIESSRAIDLSPQSNAGDGQITPMTTMETLDLQY